MNVLLALTNPAHQHHAVAHAWLADTARFVTTPVTESGLLRLLLNPTVTGQHVSARQALAIVAGVRAHRRGGFLPDGTSLSEASIDLIGLTGHRQVTDLHLVNLAKATDCTLVTFDRHIAGALSVPDRGCVLVL